MPRRRCTLALAAVLLLALPATASASLGGKVGHIVSASRFAGAGTGIAIYDDSGNSFVYRLRSNSELKPASNMKLTTAAVAFADLGIGRRLSTRVYRTGTLSGGTLTGSLWLVGGGDPSLSTDMFASRAFNGAGGHLSDLAAAVRAAGIRRLSGRVFGDESMFDSARRGPYGSPSYWKDCPPITALSVNKDLISFFKPYAYNQPAVRAADALRGALKKQGVTVGHDPRAGTLP